MFGTYDRDSSGFIDVTEFLAIMRNLDPSVEKCDVEQSFELVGARDVLDEQQFWQWCCNVFGQFEDVMFVQQMEELLSDGAKQVRDKSGSEGNRREW